MSMRAAIGLLLVTACIVPGMPRLCTTADAQPLRHPPEAAHEPPEPGLWHKSAAGGQLGPWFANELGTDITTGNARLRGNKTGFHLELFYLPHLFGAFNLDINAGAISRGEFQITDPETQLSDFGNATLYPLGLGIVATPLASKKTLRVQPTLRAGGSGLILTERLEFTRVNDFVVGVDASKTHFEFGYYAGGGVDIVLGPSVMLLGTVKYQHARFDKDVLGARDYSGVQVLFGAAYIYR